MSDKILKSQNYFTNIICVSVISFLSNGIRNNLRGQEISQWSLSELLINYQGGFVRRGLFGQIVFETTNPIYFATLFQKVALFLLFLGIIAFIIFEKSNLVKVVFTTCLTFAPGGLQDMRVGNTYQGGLFEYLDRKEIWFYLGIVLFYFFIKVFFEFPLVNSILLSIFSVLLILHHELFIIFSLTLYTTIFISTKVVLKSRELLAATIFYLSTFAAFALVFFNHGDEETANKILSSYETKFPGLPINGGGIHAIAWTINKSHELPLRLVSEGSVLYYIFFATMSILFLIIYTVVKFRKTSHFSLALLLNFGNLVGCLLITYVFWDVGRLISIYTISTLLSLNVLALAISKLENAEKFKFANSKETTEKFVNKFILISVLTFLVFINFVTRVEHCCPQPSNIPLSNFFGLLK